MSKCDHSIAWRHYARIVLAGLTFACLIGRQLQGQTATAQDDPADAGSEAPLVLSPFIVSAERDVGYQASNTLAGSRLNSALVDTPAAISVMTKQFLDDIGATDINDALEYSLNGGTDLGGDFTGNTANSQDVVGQLRGFGDIRQARNYFETPAVALDTFNIERLDFARGPNAVLFGIGGAGGIINTTPKLAHPGQRP
ncbi:MAG TPA: TonB-dependent receptor plug domain-containing protein, partial [Opitutaceae bacterium]|nr:TonB-dependent receptor plug domain-containing protein [Opitutaceae bacterium]